MARCRCQLFVSSSVQLPPPKCQKYLFQVPFTGRRKLRGHESHPKWVGFFIPFNSKKLTPIDKRLANTPSQHGFVRCRFLRARAAPCARFDSLQGKIKNLAGFFTTQWVSRHLFLPEKSGELLLLLPTFAWKYAYGGFCGIGAGSSLTPPRQIDGIYPPVSPLPQKERQNSPVYSRSLPYEFLRRLVFCVSHTSPFGRNI